MDDPAVDALRRLVARTEGGRAAVAKAIRANEQTIYQILRGVPLKSGKQRTVGRDLRERLDRRFPGWLSISQEPPDHQRGHAPVAHSVSHLPETMAENKLTWEEILKGAPLGTQFQTKMPDDSCGDRCPRGHWIVWRTDKAPEFGKLVLAKDGHGQLHARVYTQGKRPGEWIGAAVNPAYASFAGTELQIVATYRGTLEPE